MDLEGVVCGLREGRLWNEREASVVLERGVCVLRERLLWTEREASVHLESGVCGLREGRLWTLAVITAERPGWWLQIREADWAFCLQRGFVVEFCVTELIL